MKSKLVIGTANFGQSYGVGVNNLQQIKEIFSAVQNKTKLFPKNLFSNDQNLINPLNGKQFHSIKWKTKSH